MIDLGSTLLDFVSIPSITGDEAAMRDRLAAVLSEVPNVSVDTFDTPVRDLVDDPRFPGIEVEREVLPGVVGTLDLGPGPTLLVVAHTDVVPEGDHSTWTSHPFRPEVRGGVLYGRGAVDMKGGLTAAIGALAALADDPGGLSGRVVVAGVPGEEDGGSGSFALIRRGIAADSCIIPEPTDLDVVVAHGGAITFTLDVPGRAAHASMRREGVSALENLAECMEALRRDEADRNASETDPRMRAIGLPYPTIIGQVEGGTWASTLPDRVRAHGRYGVTIHQDAAGAADDLRRAVDAFCREHPFLAHDPIQVRVWGGRFDSAAVPDDHPLPTGIAHAHATVTGSHPGLVGVPYGADMRLFVQEAGIPTVMYGPGDVRAAHAADEGVALDEVRTCADVIASWAREVLTP